MKHLTTETRRRGENQDRVIGRSGDLVIGNTVVSCHPEQVRVPQRETSASRTRDRDSGISRRRDIGRAVICALRVVVQVLHEIFDESAYERFLGRTESARSVASYRAFLREREAAIVRKPRCC